MALTSQAVADSGLVRTLMRETLISYVLLPLADLLADPDFINQHLAMALSPESMGLRFVDSCGQIYSAVRANTHKTCIHNQQPHRTHNNTYP